MRSISTSLAPTPGQRSWHPTTARQWLAAPLIALAALALTACERKTGPTPPIGSPPGLTGTSGIGTSGATGGAAATPKSSGITSGSANGTPNHSTGSATR